MTKTLTEQWREGMLPNGEYYVKDWDGTTNWFVAQNNILWRDLNNPIYASERIEVLAPVPSYEEFVQQRDFVKDHQKVLIENMNLKRKLEIATKALKEYESAAGWGRQAFLALKEIEGVK